MTMTLQTAIKRAAETKASDATAHYRKLIVDAAKGTEVVDPDHFIDVAEAAGIDPETASKHLDVLTERFEARRGLDDHDSPDALQRRAEAESEAKRLYAEFERVRDECKRRLDAAHQAAAVAQRRADLGRESEQRAKQTAAQTLHRTCDPSISEKIERLNLEIRQLQEEQNRNALRPKYRLSELNAYRDAMGKPADKRTAADRDAIARMGQAWPTQSDWAESERAEQRKTEIPAEIQAKNEAIGELRKRQLDPLGGMKW